MRDASNTQALTWLERPSAWPGLRLAVHGEAGCGKTHLLHLFAARHSATLIAGSAIGPLSAFPESGPLAIDDADAVGDEAALLHFLNAAAEQGFAVLLSARTPPSRWPVELPDLASRLRAMMSVALGRPGDALLRALLARLLADLQLSVPETVQAYLLARLPRSAASLREAVFRLDQASLLAGRGITRAVAAAVIEEMGHASHDVFASDPPDHSPDPVALI